MISRDSIIRLSISRLEAISKPARAAVLIVFLTAASASAQSMFVGGDYVLGNRAAGMSAYVADPDYAHAVFLNPAKLGFAETVYAASDYEYFSRDPGLLFLPSTPSDYLSNGKFSAWDASLVLPLGPFGAGASFSAFDLAGWRTTTSDVGAGVRIPFGFSLGVTGKYITLRKNVAVPGATGSSDLEKFTFDVGAMNRTILANTTFFRAIFSSGIVFTNILPSVKWSGQLGVPLADAAADLPQTFQCGLAYTFASNYRLSDFELFKVTGAIDYSHLFSNSSPIDGFILPRDQYRVGLETIALGILAVRIGYTLKTPVLTGEDLYNRLTVSRMGSGVSYGFSLRFPVKLVLPALPVTSLELSYAKNPEWNSGVYHDLFGVVMEMLF